MRPDSLTIREAEACVIGADGRREQRAYSVLAEHTLSISLDGLLWKRVVCTRGDLREMLAGNLFTELRIDRAEEITRLELSEDEASAEICVAPGPFPRRKLQKFTKSADWRPEWVRSLANRLREGMPLYQETFAAHCAFLSRAGEILFACEVISRHNAVDKVLGHALLRGVPPGECMLFTSGRVPADMAEKAVAAGVPVLVSKAGPTADAVSLARTYGLTLIGCAREDGFAVF